MRESDLLFADASAIPDNGVLAYEAVDGAWVVRANDPHPSHDPVQWALDAGVHVVDHECTDCGSTLFDIHL